MFCLYLKNYLNTFSSYFSQPENSSMLLFHHPSISWFKIKEVGVYVIIYWILGKILIKMLWKEYRGEARIQLRFWLCHFRAMWFWTSCLTSEFSFLICLLFNCSVMSDSLWPLGLQHPRLPCPSLSPKNLLNLMSIESVMPSNHLMLCGLLLFLSSVFQALESFPVSQLFASGGWSIAVSASASVVPMNIQGWFPLGLIG